MLSLCVFSRGARLEKGSRGPFGSCSASVLLVLSEPWGSEPGVLSDKVLATVAPWDDLEPPNLF